MMPRSHGFSLVELVVSLTILSILGLICAPLLQVSSQRAKEAELRNALRQIRTALDRYKAAADEGRVEKPVDGSGYPPSLEVLVKGVADKKTPQEDTIFFLRRVPRDPLYPDPAVPAEKTWGLRSYASSAESPRSGDDVFDVYSMSQGKALDGTKYNQW